MPPAYRIYSEVWGKTYIFLVFVLTDAKDEVISFKIPQKACRPKVSPGSWN